MRYWVISVVGFVGSLVFGAMIVGDAVFAQQINLPPEVKTLACPSVLMLGGGGPEAVLVDVGADASASDDGLPVGGNLSYNWTLEVGPRFGTVTWLDPNVLHPKACFTFPGKFYFTFEVTDGELTSTDMVEITITRE